MTASETEFQHWVMETARTYGWLCCHYHKVRVVVRGRPRWITPVKGDAGGPDLLLARAGMVLLVELKTNVGSRSPKQHRWAQELGECYRLWRPSDRKVILEELKTPGALTPL